MDEKNKKKDLFSEINEIVADFNPPSIEEKDEEENPKPPSTRDEIVAIMQGHPFPKGYKPSRDLDSLNLEGSVLSVRMQALQMGFSIHEIPDEVIYGWLDYAAAIHGKPGPFGTPIHATQVLMELIYERRDIRGDTI